jgi:hypothetical protein
MTDQVGVGDPVLILQLRGFDSDETGGSCRLVLARRPATARACRGLLRSASGFNFQPSSQHVHRRRTKLPERAGLLALAVAILDQQGRARASWGNHPLAAGGGRREGNAGKWGWRERVAFRGGTPPVARARASLLITSRRPALFPGRGEIWEGLHSLPVRRRPRAGRARH